MSEPLVFVLPDAGDVVSGGHLYNQRIIEALRAAGCHVEQIELASAGDRMRSDSPARFIFDSLYLDPGSAAELARLPMENTSAMLLAHHLHSLFPPAGRTADEVFATHEWPQLSRFAGCWATSPFMAEYLVERGIEADRIITVEPGFEATVSGRLELGTPPRVLLVANLMLRKGVLELLMALAECPDLPPFELRILGGDLEPEYARACRELVRSRAELASRVEFAGVRPPDEMPEEYRCGDLLISVAAMETFGMALQEAMAHGLPLLLREGGYSGRHLIDRGAGEVHESVEKLAASLLGLLSEPMRLAKLKRAAHVARPPRRTWDDAARSLLDQLS